MTDDLDDDDDDDFEMPQVAASEADLIAMSRALTAPHAFDVWALLAGSRALPAKIGPTSARLIGDALAQVWPALWKRDGARPGASVENGKAVRGRGWDRHPPTPLVFTGSTIALLRWLVGMPLATASNVDKLPARGLKIGDQVAIYLALDLATGPAQSTIAAQPMVREAPLAWLGYAHLMQGTPPAFDSLASGPGAVVVEALQLELGARWRTVELGKRTTTDPEALVRLGAVQDATLQGFMAACDKTARRDLAAFVLDAALPLLDRNIAPIPSDLDLTKPLSVRAAARLAAGALLRGIQLWSTWDERHRGVRFLDDDYEAAQLLLSRFERIGRHGADRNAAWLAELASLAPTTPTPADRATIEAP
jgi:hypothetical protein